MIRTISRVIGVAAGLSVGREGFEGDAVADPLSGLHLAQAIAEHVRDAKAGRLDVVMRDVVRCSVGEGEPLGSSRPTFSKRFSS